MARSKEDQLLITHYQRELRIKEEDVRDLMNQVKKLKVENVSLAAQNIRYIAKIKILETLIDEKEKPRI